MHPCLYITEIWRAISESLYEDHNADVLAVLARTCCASSEPAIDFLWKEQFTLGNLVRCMPADLYSVDLDAKMVSFRRPLEDTDWTKFDFYSRKIRHFGASPFCSWIDSNYYEVDEGVLCSLASYRPVRELLPNVRIMELFNLTQHSQILLGPSIHRVVVDDLNWDFSLLGTWFSSLARLSPHIQELEIYVEEASQKFLPALLTLICGLNDLRDLHFESLECSPQLIRRLGSLPSLKQLYRVQVTPENVPFFTTSSGRFPCLEALTFDASNCSMCVTLLDSMHCCFNKLDIHTTTRRPVCGVKSLTECISRHPCVASLTTISLYISTLRLEPIADVGSSDVPDLFSPLFYCTSLERVTLTMSNMTELDDSWIMAASSAWPLLRALSLSTIGGGVPPQMTLAGLIPLVKHCRKLYSLHLILDVKPIDSHRLNGVSNDLIEALHLGNCSTISEPGRVARSLIRMFPNLFAVSVNGFGEAGQGFMELKRLLEATA